MLPSQCSLPPYIPTRLLNYNALLISLYSPLKLSEMPLTQWRSSVGVSYPSPLKTWLGSAVLLSPAVAAPAAVLCHAARLAASPTWLLGTLCRLVQCETHPRWPPLSVSLNFTALQQTHQLAQTISVRVIKFELSSRRITAPGTVSKNAGHPQPDALGSAMS
jgi:hypothetical protein